MDQSGHFILGNPEHNLAVNMDAFAKSGWFARGGIQHVSAFFVDNGNTVKKNKSIPEAVCPWGVRGV